MNHGDVSDKKVKIETNSEHACCGFVLSCSETDRSIASFWHDYDAEMAANAINNHDRLTNRVKVLESAINEAKKYPENGNIMSRILIEALNDE